MAKRRVVFICARQAIRRFRRCFYIHAHGNAYDIGANELLCGRKALLSPLGPEFARRGYAVLMVELPAFGTRADPGESARAKAALWNGRSLAGQMLGEQAAAFDYLAARSDVIAERIAIFGISMGATFSYWLSAVEERLAASAHLCAYADFAALIAAGNIDLHGIYLTVPALLNLAGKWRDRRVDRAAPATDRHWRS